MDIFFSVEKLREHWEQAYAKVNQRKNQLDDMLLECRQFDEMYAEFDRWILQVEDELDSGKIDPKAEDIDKQIAKQKVRNDHQILGAYLTIKTDIA